MALETLQCLPVLEELFGREIQGDVTAESAVLGLADHNDSPVTQLPQDAIARNALADHKRHPELMGLS